MQHTTPTTSVKPSIVILSGAGISAESGIRTFRANDGLWESHHIEDVATPEAFSRNPALVQQFYNARRAQLMAPDIQPNAAHTALARLESAMPHGEVLIVTQNVDDLHERGGSRELIHMHGELLKARCQRSDTVFDQTGDLDENSLCSCCQQKGTLRPHIVWFGEMPLDMDRIYDALRHCDLFASIGTSGNVYPAAGFVEEAKRHGAHTVEINIDQSHISDAFDEHRLGRASEQVPRWVDDVLSTQLS
ncbi:NAD-dependent protein deacylase [bacterium]|nr:NAD-dependent protein deacylase [bacterium]